MTTTSSSFSNNNMSVNYLLWLGHASIAILWGLSQQVYIPYPVLLLSLVTAILYVSCHQSLPLAPHVHDALTQHAADAASNGDSASAAAAVAMEPRETLRKEDAYQFPIVGSIALFGLYLAFKYLDKDLVNLLISGYFAMAGVIAMTITFNPYMEAVLVVPNRRFGWEWKVHHSLPEWVAGPSPWDWGLDLTFSHILSFGVALIVLALYFTSEKAWFLNNVLAISFCLQGVRNFSVGSFQIAAILLIGLFFYDIFWVFGTEVMVKVATNLDGPIKILLPRDSIEKDPETGKLNLSLLGLGDIVIPGFFLALMLRFDLHQCLSQNPKFVYDPLRVEHTNFPKPYFHATLIGYILGLGTTLFVMFQFNAAQPALLYLVPACLGTSFGCAVLRGEVKALLQYSEEEEEVDGGEVNGAEKEANGNSAPAREDKPLATKKDE